MELEERLDELRQLWPNLEWIEAEILDYDHDVVFLDDAYVFRFACEDPEHEPMEREVKFLKKLRQTTVAVPDYTHVDDRYQVAGYRPISGESLTYEKSLYLPRDQRRNVAAGVAEVLNEVHGFSLGEAEALGIPEDDPWYEKVRGFLFEYLRIVRQGSLTNEEMSYCDGVVKEIMTSDISKEIPQCVIHADIEPPHILIDGNRFAGVIDFGDVLIGDRACDLGWLWELGEGFIDDFLSHYRHGSEDLKQRGRWFWFGRAMREMEQGAKYRHRESWERRYRFFPEVIAAPDRAAGSWD